MEERDYMKAANRARISMAANILKDVIPGEDYGIKKEDLTSITKPLRDAEEKLFASINIDE